MCKSNPHLSAPPAATNALKRMMHYWLAIGTSRELARAALEPSTRATYASAVDAYLRFCTEHGIDPNSDLSIAARIANLSDRDLSFSWIANTISAIKDSSRFSNTAKLAESPVVKQALKAARKVAPRPTHTTPITRDHLLAMWSDGSTGTAPQFFLALLGYRAFLRASELVNLRIDDLWIEEFDPAGFAALQHKPLDGDQAPASDGLSITLVSTSGPATPIIAYDIAWAKSIDPPTTPVHLAHDPTVLATPSFNIFGMNKPPEIPHDGILPNGNRLAIVLTIHSSKANKFRSETVLVGGDSDERLSPLLWLYYWWSILPRKKAGFPLFQQLGRKERGLSLAASSPRHIMIDLAKRAGIPPSVHLVAHSLRAGGATAAAHAAIDQRVIKRHGRWRSDAVYAYIKDSANEFLDLNAAVGAPKPRRAARPSRRSNPSTSSSASANPRSAPPTSSTSLTSTSSSPTLATSSASVPPRP